MLLHAEEGKISFNLILTPITTSGIQVDSTKLILYDGDSSNIEQLVISKDTIAYLFDGLDAGKYFLTVQLYQQDYILAESRSGGYLKEDETKEIRGTVSFACAYPILYISWNPDITLHGNDFYNFIIDPDSNFIKRYPLDNLDSLSEAFLESGIHYYQECPVNWGLLDSNLIPMVHYSFGDYRNPVTTCHTVFAFYDEYMKSTDSLSFAGFENNANWLLDNCDSNYYLHYEFNFNHSGAILPAGWVSGMAQGLSLAALSMAYYLTNEQKYLDGAHGIFTTMYRNSGDYFCIGVDEKDYYWLEEYPCTKFCHVFNGMVSGLWGLWCYYSITGENFARVLLEAGFKSLVDNYPQWNYPDKDLSYYCLHLGTNTSYHKKHIQQLRYFGDYFNIQEMHHAADCFSNKYFAAYPHSLTLSSDKDTSELTMFSTLNWDVESDHDWLTFEQTGSKLLVYCSENNFYQSRVAKIFFTGSGTNEIQTIKVTQDAPKIYPISDIDTFIVTSESGFIWFEVNLVPYWMAGCANEWIEASKVNDTILAVKYLENTLSVTRTAILEFCLQDSTLYQTLKIIQYPDTVYLSVMPDSVWVSADQGEVEILIYASHHWEITYDTSWIEAQKINDNLLLLKYPENTDFFTTRTTKITIFLTDSLLIKELKVEQQASPHYLCVYPDSIMLSAEPGEAEIILDASSDWEITNDTSWIEALKINDTLLLIRYLGNTDYYNARVTDITIFLTDSLLIKILKIRQQPAPLYLDVHPDSITITADSGYFEINIQSPVIWSIKTSDAWLHASQQNDTLVSVNYEMNTLFHNRNATITISLNDTLFRIIKVAQAGSTAGITDNSVLLNLEIYPNPAQDEIHLRFVLNQEVPVNIEIYDISGRLISRPFNKRLMPAGHDITIGLAGWEKGLYLVRFCAGNQILTRKIAVF